MAEVVTCLHCGEVQSSGDGRCARCGKSMESPEERKTRRAQVEEGRREVERTTVAIQRLPGFGTNGDQRASFGTREFFTEMSNQRRRRFIAIFVVIGVGFGFFLSR